MSILCHVYRGKYIESKHVVYAVVVGETGKIVYASGDPEYVTCIRSSLKPFQAAAGVKAGAVAAAGFSEAELALMCASHNGEEIHVKTARSMMAKLGFPVDFYECGSHYPYHRATREELIRSGIKPEPFHNNCSGKHAGMLCLAKHLGVDPTGYTNPDHPVQKAIFDLVKIYTGLEKIPYAIDGCSAPTMFLSLRKIAGLFQTLMIGEYPELRQVKQAMVNNPYLIAGEKRFDTDFITALRGRAITKVGGEAVRGIGIRTEQGETFGIALKVLDGNQRCMPVATMALLEHLDLLTAVEMESLRNYRSKKLLNHREIHVGDIRAEIE
ncbi:MAG: asparaginase [FCB group bacterium]|nr:asparaginase [FCB group bacterium]